MSPKTTIRAGSSNIIERFSRELIAGYLDRSKLKYLRDADNDYLVLFAREGGRADLHVWFIAGGPNDAIYTIMCVAATPSGYDMDHWLRVCNDWNSQKRWPKAYVSASSGTAKLNLALESHLDLEAGVSRALFDTHTREILLGVFEFFEWLDERLGRAGEGTSGADPPALVPAASHDAYATSGPGSGL